MAARWTWQTARGRTRSPFPWRRGSCPCCGRSTCTRNSCVRQRHLRHRRKRRASTSRGTLCRSVYTCPSDPFEAPERETRCRAHATFHRIRITQWCGMAVCSRYVLTLSQKVGRHLGKTAGDGAGNEAGARPSSVNRDAEADRRHPSCATMRQATHFNR